MGAETAPSPGGVTSVLGSLPVLGVDRIVRRTLLTAGVIGVIAGGLAVAAGYPLAAPGIALGLALALGNHRVFQSSAMRFTTPEGTVRRKPFAGSVLLRLGVCTAVAIVLLIWVRTLFRFYGRVARSNFPAADIAISIVGVPLFIWLLVRSSLHHQVAKSVTWKGRSYKAGR